MAKIIQDPGGDRPGVCIVLRGERGVGKGTFVNIFGSLFGSHYIQVTHSQQVTGRFNAHLKDSILVFVDEGFWAGDKQAEGLLKAMITEPFVNIEQKGRDVIRVENHMNLIIASNDKWVVPAGLHERRFVVLDVSAKYQQNHKYFEAIHTQMKSGGREALLYDMLDLDITEKNLREAPMTKGLIEQIVLSMDTVDSFWFERLREGTLSKYDDTWTGEIPKNKMYSEYEVFAQNRRKQYPESNAQFFIKFRRLCKNIEEVRPRLDGGKRTRSLLFPSLEDCRQEFKKAMAKGSEWKFDDIF